MKLRKISELVLYEDPLTLWNECLNFFSNIKKRNENEEINSARLYKGEIVLIPCTIPYTMEGLLNYLGMVKKEWKALREKPETNRCCEYVEQVIQQNLLELAFTKMIDPNFTRIYLGLVDRNDKVDEGKDPVVFYLPDNGRQLDEGIEVPLELPMPKENVRKDMRNY